MLCVVLIKIYQFISRTKKNIKYVKDFLERELRKIYIVLSCKFLALIILLAILFATK